MVSRRIVLGTALIGLLLASALPRRETTPPTLESAAPAPIASSPDAIEHRLSEEGFQDSKEMSLSEIPQPSAARDAGPLDPDNPATADQQLSRGASNSSAAPFADYTPPGIPRRAPWGSGNVGAATAPSADADAATGDTGDAMLDTLTELQRGPTPPPFNQRIFGARTSGATPTAAPVEPTATVGPTATPTVTPTPTISPVGGQATGYMMLQLMEPAARQSVERQIKILLDSKVMTLYLGVLVDGTFEKDYPYLANVVRRLNTEGRSLTLSLFFSNGSAQRSYETAYPGGLFNTIEPVNFRSLIEFDPTTQNTFRSAVAEALPVYDLNLSLNSNNKNYAVPMLEDNLDYNSYRAMRRITRAALQGKAEVMRNPCPGCSSDRLSNADPLGSGLESHSPSDIPKLSRRDGFAFDGPAGFSFPGETFGLSLDEVKRLKEIAIARELRYIGLWRGQRQGLGPGTSTDTP
ncbi:MAG: hypothetical protein EBZ48_08505, partial [Proteobacteria bacterium]|nr:hypothetical protein [Pseudomonadota bacterium]